MNKVFQEILQTNTAVSFLTWYRDRYPNKIPIFKESEFSEQLGIFIQYFGDVHNLTYSVAKEGYYIYQLDSNIPNESVRIRNAATGDKWIYRELFNKPLNVSSLYLHQLAILRLFNSLDLPF